MRLFDGLRHAEVSQSAAVCLHRPPKAWQNMAAAEVILLTERSHPLDRSQSLLTWDPELLCNALQLSLQHHSMHQAPAPHHLLKDLYTDQFCTASDMHPAHGLLVSEGQRGQAVGMTWIRRVEAFSIGRAYLRMARAFFTGSTAVRRASARGANCMPTASQCSP